MVAEVGVMEVPLEAAVTLPAGDVWVQLVTSQTMPIAVGPDELVFYKDHDFATPLPDPYGVGSDYEGPRMSLFILGTLPE